MKKYLSILLALAMCVTFLGCQELEGILENADVKTIESAEEAKAALDGKGEIRLGADYEEINQFEEIWVNNSIAGVLRETGLLNTKWTVSVKQETRFYVAYVTDQPVNDQPGIDSGNTYGFYDAEDNCLGYAQERLNGEGTWQYVFLDNDLDPTGLEVSLDGKALWRDGNLIAEGRTNALPTENMPTFWISCREDTPLQGKIVMYLRMYRDAYEEYKLYH